MSVVDQQKEEMSRVSCFAMVFIKSSNGLTHYTQLAIKSYRPGPGCLKRTMSLVNVSLKIQTLVSQICQYFSLKKVRRFCKNISVFGD